MTNKQIIVMILAFTLVAVFCATGVCFADTSVDPPVFIPGESIPNFSQLISGVPFYFGFSSAPSEMDDWAPLYNDVYYKVVTVSGNTVIMHLMRNEVSRPLPAFDITTQYVGLKYSSGTARAGTTSRSNPSSDPSGWNTFPNVNDISVSYGSSFIWQDLASAAYVQSMSIPAGYALRIYSSNSFTLQELDLSVPNSWNFPKDSLSSVRYNGSRYSLYLNENIVQGASADSGNFVPWNALNANLFGRASAYSYTWEPSDYTLYPSYSYVITNPFYAGEAVQNESAGFHQNTDMIATVYYSASDPVVFDLVPLRQSLSAQDGTFYYANAFDLSAGVIHGTITPGENEDPGTVDFGNPPIGGGNADQPPLSENTTIFGVLNTLTSTITDLFNRAGDAMRSLVQSSNSFFTAVIGFFGWLPPEWSAVMWSFFLVLTVLGVVKLFL